MKISIDKLPIKRVDAIEENGVEKFPPEIGEDEKRLSLIGRIDFTPLVERDSKKAKTSKDPATTAPWQWQSLVESLQLAHQELSVVIDLINTVEANDAVTVVGMTRPKLLPHEILSDLAVSAATKLQCFWHLGRYFKESANALERQIMKEARFYGALIRLQQNWKVKHHRLTAAPSEQNFTFDLFDNSRRDITIFRPTSISTVHVNNDSSGLLAIRAPAMSCRFIHFRFVRGPKSKTRTYRSITDDLVKNLRQDPMGAGEELKDEDVDHNIMETHSILRKIHRAIFDEQPDLPPCQGTSTMCVLCDYLDFDSSLPLQIWSKMRGMLTTSLAPAVTWS